METDVLGIDHTRTYFYGYDLCDILENFTLARLGKYIGHGLCYEAGALAMIEFYGNSSAKLVQGYSECTDGRHRHCWVELKLKGQEYVADFSRYGPFLMSKSLYYDEEFGELPEPVWICSYKEFWNQPTSKKLRYRFERRELSYVFPWLYFYRPPYEFDRKSGEKFGFCQVESDWQVRKALVRGYSQVYCNFYNVLLSTQIINEFCADRKCTYPSFDARLSAFTAARKFEHRYLCDGKKYWCTL